MEEKEAYLVRLKFRSTPSWNEMEDNFPEFYEFIENLPGSERNGEGIHQNVMLMELYKDARKFAMEVIEDAKT